MRDDELDDLLGRDYSAPDPILLDRISRRLASSLRPARPLPPVWLLTSLLLLSAAAIAFTAASILGFYGLENLSGPEIASIFASLAAFGTLMAALSSLEMAPGSRRHASPASVILLGALAILAVFALFFHNYSTSGFLHWGIACLKTGLLAALPAGLLAWLVLRRGMALNPVAAGAAIGALAGLAGTATLELHCPSHLALHVMIWHFGVIPVAAVAGAIIGAVAARFHPESAQN